MDEPIVRWIEDRIREWDRNIGVQIGFIELHPSLYYDLIWHSGNNRKEDVDGKIATFIIYGIRICKNHNIPEQMCRVEAANDPVSVMLPYAPSGRLYGWRKE